MIIKKVVLENIRSYEKEEISFNEGSTLLAGDIGSGKSSVLLAIEFGLFGLQPGQKGSALLRNNTDNGSVELHITIGNGQYIIERSLKRKTNSIVQDISALSINGIREELSITGLKAKVLEILNYPEELAKKQNSLYKYTVYTPQEEMKQIIREDTETRLNTIRQVFGLDKYKKIMDNLGIIRTKLRGEKKTMEGSLVYLEDDKEKLKAKEKELYNTTHLANNTRESLELKTAERIAAENKYSWMMDTKDIVNIKAEKSVLLMKAETELKKLKHDRLVDEIVEVATKKHINDWESSGYEDFLEVYEADLKELERQAKEKVDNRLVTETELKGLRKSLGELKRDLSGLEALTVCPTCKQNVEDVYKYDIFQENKARQKIIEDGIKVFEDKIDNEGLIVVTSLITKYKKKIEVQKKLKAEADLIPGEREKLKKIQDEFRPNVERTEELGKIISGLKDDLEQFKEGMKELDKQNAIIGHLKTEELSLSLQLASQSKEEEMLVKANEDLESRIIEAEVIKTKLEYSIELEEWLTKMVLPLISFLETTVMENVRSEFSDIFADWFQILVPETLSVTLSDSFAPVIEQNDCEVDYNYLSGGEKTAVALAYRLALNQVINSSLSDLKTKDLVILDEPTDGFSSQQLDKMREVLEQLDAKQLIIVSHETKMEDFMENVIKFEKNNGVSVKN